MYGYAYATPFSLPLPLYFCTQVDSLLSNHLDFARALGILRPPQNEIADALIAHYSKATLVSSESTSGISMEQHLQHLSFLSDISIPAARARGFPLAVSVHRGVVVLKPAPHIFWPLDSRGAGNDKATIQRDLSTAGMVFLHPRVSVVVTCGECLEKVVEYFCPFSIPPSI